MDTLEQPVLPSVSTSSSEVMVSSTPICTAETAVVAHDGSTVPEAIIGIPDMSRRKKFRLSTTWYLVRFKKDLVLHVCRDTEFVYRRREQDQKIVSFGKYGGCWYECVLLSENSKKAPLQRELNAAKRRSLIAIGRRGRKSNNFSLVRFHLTRDHQILPSSELGDRNESGYCSIKCPDGVVRLAIVLQMGTFDDLSGRLAKCRNFDELTTPEKSKRRHPYVPYTPRVRMPFSVPLLASTPTTSTSPRYLSSALSPRDDKSLLQLHSPAVQKSPLLRRSPYKSFKRSASMESINSCKWTTPLALKKRLFGDIPEEDPLKIEEPCTDLKDLGTLTLPSTMESLEGYPCSDASSIDCDADKPFSPMNLQSPQSEVDPYLTDSDTDYKPSIYSSSSSPAPSLSSELETSLSSAIFSESSTTAQMGTNDTTKEIDCYSHDDDIGTAGPSTSKAKPPYKRKASVCIYCNKICVRLQRHLASVHDCHPQVVQIKSIADKEQRMLAWKKLRLAGNYKYNCGVLQKGEGEMILQRANPNYEAEDYLACLTCKGFYKRQAMYKHVKRCKVKHVKYERVQSLGLMLLPRGVFKKGANEKGLQLLTSLVYPRMLADKFTNAAQRDEMIVLCGINYCQTHMQEKSKAYLHKVASQRMRSLARILLVLQRKYGKTCTLKSFLVPQSFDDVVEATATACGLIEGQYTSPSLSITLGHVLKTCAKILQGEAARTGDNILHESSSRFLTLMKNDWKSQLTGLATLQLKRTRFQNRSTKLLPLAEDVLLFSRFLQSEESRLVQNLNPKFTHGHWMQLNQVLLCSLILFNRKRVGDVEKIQITSFQNKCEASPDSAIYEALSPSEKVTAASYMHFYTTGKKDSQVAVMVPVTQVPAFDLMISLREKAGVSDDNMFLFGKGENLFFSGCEAMRTLSTKSGAKNANLLRSTKLRKQVATMSQVMNMQPGDLDVLAKFLGHSIDVHRQFYRLPDEALHLAKISKLLVAVSSGNVDAIRGKSLDELETPTDNTDLTYLGEMDDDDIVGKDTEDDPRVSPDYSRDTPLSEPSTSNLPRCEPRPSTAADSCKPLKRLCPPSGERKGPQNCKPWSTAEKDAVYRHFSVSIEENICPNKAEVDACLRLEPILRSRTWKVIKACVRNMAITRARRAKRNICKSTIS